MKCRESGATSFPEKIYDQKAFSISSGSGAVKERAFPVKKGKAVGVERMAADPAALGIIEIISDQGTADIAHMNPDLMSPAGFQL